MSYLDDPFEMARAYDEATEAEAAPFFWSQLRTDEARLAEMDALRAGLPAPPPSPGEAWLKRGAMTDADLFRALMEIVHCLAFPDEVMARPQIKAKLATIPQEPPPPLPGPDRETLLRLVGA